MQGLTFLVVRSLRFERGQGTKPLNILNKLLRDDLGFRELSLAFHRVCPKTHFRFPEQTFLGYMDVQIFFRETI